MTLHQGWTRALAGPDFALDPCAPRDRVFPAWATQAPSSEEEPLALESWTRFDPIEWLDRHAPEARRAPVLAALARTLHVEPG
jgi:hypothetical protein